MPEMYGHVAIIDNCERMMNTIRMFVKVSVLKLFTSTYLICNDRVQSLHDVPSIFYFFNSE